MAYMEPREEYARAFGSWLAERLTIDPELVKEISSLGETHKEGDED